MKFLNLFFSCFMRYPHSIGFNCLALLIRDLYTGESGTFYVLCLHLRIPDVGLKV